MFTTIVISSFQGSLVNRGQCAGLAVIPSVGSLKQGHPGAPATPASFRPFRIPARTLPALSLLAPHQYVLKEKLRGGGELWWLFGGTLGRAGPSLAAPLLPFGTGLSTRGGRRGLGTTEPTILGLQV